MNDQQERKARIELAHAIRLLMLELGRLATEIERPVREAPFVAAEEPETVDPMKYRGG